MRAVEAWQHLFGSPGLRQPNFSAESSSSSQHGGSLWSPKPSPVVRITSWPTTSSDSKLRIRALVVVFVLLISCSLGGAILVFRKGGGDKRRRKRGPRVCLVFDAERAEPGLAPVLAELLRVLVKQTNADVTALRLDDARQLALPVALEAIDSGTVRWVALPSTQHRYDGSPAAVASYRALEWLRELESPFEHIIFHASGGGGYYPLLAREEALALVQTRVTVISLAPRELMWKRRPGLGASIEELEENHMQRGMAMRADVLVASSVALRFMRHHRWSLPRLFAAFDRREGGRAATAARAGEDEGDDDSDDDDAANPDGRSHSGGGSWQRLADLWRLLPLMRPPPKAEVLLQNLEVQAQLERGNATSGTSRLSRRRRANLRSKSGLPDADLRGGQPMVSVVVVHHERGALLLQALDSIRRQTLRPRLVQAVVVDDGSVSPAALAVLERVGKWPELHREDASRWLLLRRPWRYLGAARNEAARHASGSYLYFLDDDNCLKRHALSTLLLAASVTNADVLTSLNEKWESLEAPPASDHDPRTERWLPLGDAAAVGIFKNCFGDAASLVRRRTFEVLGGFTEDGGVGHEDWELWARAVLQGYRLRVVPEALYWYRLGRGSMLAESIGGGMLATAQRHANHARNIRPYLQRLAGWPEAQDALRLAQGMFLLQQA